MIIEVENISKNYGKINAIKNWSFAVKEGEIYGLIGPDGAGKTTMFRILTTMILPTKGIAKINGLDVIKDYRKIRNIIGYMPGKFSLYQDLTVEENLNFFATIFKTTLEENRNLIESIYSQIEPFKNRKAGALSGGMKQKLALCCALIHKPTVLFLDEPTTGVDVVSRKEFWSMLQNLKEQGISIMVSTPYMDEAIMCDKIALVANGNFLKVNTPQGILKEYPSKIYSIKSNLMHKLLIDLKQMEEINSSFSFGENFHITIKEGFSILELQEILLNKGYKEIEIKEIEPNIEDCFMALI
jgi:ABC-2 type transport system ATP-binding protein